MYSYARLILFEQIVPFFFFSLNRTKYFITSKRETMGTKEKTASKTAVQAKCKLLVNGIKNTRANSHCYTAKDVLLFKRLNFAFKISTPIPPSWGEYKLLTLERSAAVTSIRPKPVVQAHTHSSEWSTMEQNLTRNSLQEMPATEAVQEVWLWVESISRDAQICSLGSRGRPGGRNLSYAQKWSRKSSRLCVLWRKEWQISISSPTITEVL